MKDGIRFVAKERLVISMIDYMHVVNEDFEHSSLVRKAADTLIISYLWEEDKNPIDYVIQLADELHIPQSDIPQIKADWETVVDKIRSGHAEDISGSDTLYLEACPKGKNAGDVRQQPYSTVMAKKRAWALKSSYMTVLQNGLLGHMSSVKRTADERSLTLLELVRHRFAPYVGMTEEGLADKFGTSHSKNRCARITKRILGVADEDRIEEFEKAGIKPKSIRLKANGIPKEDISFPAFSYFDVLEQDFEDSCFFEYLQQTYLFVIYREGEDGRYRLSDVCFWRMPDADIPEAKRCYGQMQQNIRAGHGDVSVKSTENRCCHVRPHGRNGQDTVPQPFGKPVVKKCFWLNKRYIADEIARLLPTPVSENKQ